MRAECFRVKNKKQSHYYLPRTSLPYIRIEKSYEEQHPFRYIHPDKSRAEYFLNNVDEDLEQIPFDFRELSDADDIIAGFKFSMKDRSALVTVIFAESYSDATEIEAANLAARTNIRWTINGSIMFGIESDDDDLANEILSFFAGRE